MTLFQSEDTPARARQTDMTLLSQSREKNIRMMDMKIANIATKNPIEKAFESSLFL